MSAPPPDNINQHVLSQFSLRGKTVAITGGSRGIGLELVEGMAEAGANVALIYNQTTTARESAAKIAQDCKVRVEAYKADVTSRVEITQTINQIAADFGKLDVVVANAGVCAAVNAVDYTEESWQTRSTWTE